jgi:hypothetical protein
MGENFLCAVGFDLQVATTNNFGLGTPYAGNIAVYPVYRMGGIASRVVSSGPSVPSMFSVKSFSGTVRYNLPIQCHVSLKYYDLQGRLLATLVNSVQGPGNYILSVRNALPSHGTYIRVFEAGTFVKREIAAIVGK